jgi:hypothetical protein
MKKNDYSLQSKIPSGRSAGARGLLILAAVVLIPIIIGGSSETVRSNLVSAHPELFAWLSPIYVSENNDSMSKCERLKDIVSGFEHGKVLTVDSSLSPPQRLVRSLGGDRFKFLRVFETERFVEKQTTGLLARKVEGREADGGVWVKDKRYAYAVYDCGLFNLTRLF